MANFSGKAPTLIVRVISLVLFLVALAAHFGIVKLDAQVAWIAGYALLLIASRVRETFSPRANQILRPRLPAGLATRRAYFFVQSPA